MLQTIWDCEYHPIALQPALTSLGHLYISVLTKDRVTSARDSSLLPEQTYSSNVSQDVHHCTPSIIRSRHTSSKSVEMISIYQYKMTRA